jgi:ABC-type glycerol-3-phosphate transport system substrate-binding protein
MTSQNSDPVRLHRRQLLRHIGPWGGVTALGGALAGACNRPAPRPEHGAGGGRVEFWQIYQNSPAVPQVKDLIQQKHPRLSVEFVDVPGGQMAEKLTVATVGGTPPDAVFINAPFFRDCARMFQPLDGWLRRDAARVDEKDFLPTGLRAATIKGKLYGLPLETAVRVWWFNRDVLAERGVPSPVRADAPRQYDYKAVEEMAQRLTFQRGDRQVWGFFVHRTWFDILIYVYGFGGRYLDDDHTRCLLNSPQALAGMQYAFDLVEKRQIAPASGGLEAYESENTLAMSYTNAARAQNLRRHQYGAFWDVGPVVKGPAAPMSFAFVHHGGIVAASRNPDGAWLAVTEYTGKDASRFWIEGHGWPTVRQSYLATWVKEGIAPPETRQNVVEWIKVSPLVTFPAGSSGTINPLATTLIREAIDGKRSLRDTAEALAREITALLEPS